MKNEISDIVMTWGWSNPPAWVVAQAEKCLALAGADLIEVIANYTGQTVAALEDKVAGCPSTTSQLDYLIERVSGLSVLRGQVLATYNETLFYEDVIDEDMLVDAMQQRHVREFCQTNRYVAFRHPENSRQVVIAFCDWYDLEKFEQAGRNEKMENPLLQALGDGVELMHALITTARLNEAFGKVEAAAVEGSSKSSNRSTWSHNQADTDSQKVMAKVFNEAIEMKATDITLWPMMDGTVYVVYRRHGALIQAGSHRQIPYQQAQEGIRFLLGRTKAQADGAVLSGPVDGNLRYRSPDKEVFTRHNYMPVNRAGVAHELIVGSIRIFNMENVDIDLANLKLPAELITDIHRVLKADKGTILVVAPVNEGKSTTVGGIISAHIKMYGAMGKKRMSVEIPVERYQEGLISINVEDEENLPHNIRALFRQDLDFAFIGEVRSSFTAAAFARVGTSGTIAATTGHAEDAASGISMVWNYLRAAMNSTGSSAEKLVVHPADFVSKLALVIAQRLVPEICDKCRIPHVISDDEIAELKHHEEHEMHTPSRVDAIKAASAAGQLFRKNEQGCPHCFLGIKGERPIAEWIPVGRRLRTELSQMVQRDHLAHEVINQYRKSSLYQSAIDLVLAGAVDLNDVAGL